MAPILPTIRGRGAAFNPPNRFERLAFEVDADLLDDEDQPAPDTVYLKDNARTIITRNDSPDVGFEFSINPYRGCSHGCIYCYARPTHEFLGLSAGLDFETRIFVKEDAPQLLRKELSLPSWKPQLLAISGVTDCYQPAERALRLTRRCLEVLVEFGNPVSVITKSHLITRDIDLLAKLASQNASAVLLSITTLDGELARRMEPRASSPARRLAAIKALSAAGIPTGVMVAPIVPGLTDHEMALILDAAAAAGAMFADAVPLRLPLAVAPLFVDWLQRHFPYRKDKVLRRILDIRGGKLNDPNFHTRMRGQGVFADHVSNMFKLARRKAGLDKPFPALSIASFKRPGEHPTLF